MRIYVNVKTPILRRAERHGISVQRVAHDAIVDAVKRAEQAAYPVRVSDAVAAANLVVHTAAEDFADILRLANIVAPVGAEERNGVVVVLRVDGWSGHIEAVAGGKPVAVRAVVMMTLALWHDLANLTGARANLGGMSAQDDATYAAALNEAGESMTAARMRLAEIVAQHADV